MFFLQRSGRMHFFWSAPLEHCPHTRDKLASDACLCRVLCPFFVIHFLRATYALTHTCLLFFKMIMIRMNSLSVYRRGLSFSSAFYVACKQKRGKKFFDEKDKRGVNERKMHKSEVKPKKHSSSVNLF